jgi:fucose permease
MMVGRFALARLANRLDRRWLTGGFAAAAGALVAAGLLLDRMPATWACHVAAGLFLSVQVPVFQSLLTSAFPGSAGTVLGLLGVATGLSGAVSPWLVGSLADAFGGAGTGIAAAFWVLPAAAAALAVVAPALATACGRKSSGSI